MTMATKPKSKPKEFSKEDLSCAICLDRLKEPKLLPCFHTYCKACLEGLPMLLRKSKNGQITCPQCRVNHPLPTGGVGEFPADRVLENALDAYALKESQAKDTTVPCSMCTEDDPSVAHCSTCGKFLCDFCAKAHKRLVNFRDHKVVTLDQLSSDVVKSLERPRYCTHHPEETLKLYCTTCQTLICRDCSIIAHRDHSFKFAKDARSEIQLQLEQAVKGVATKQQEFEAHLAFIKEAEKTRNAYSVTLNQQVNQAFDSYIRSLELLRKQLLGKEATAKVSDMKQIWGQQQSIEMTLANIASGLRYAERLRGCPSDMDMLAMSSKVREQLVTLQKAQWNPKVNLSCSPLLVFSSQGQEYVANTATLKTLDAADSFTISIQPEGLPAVSATQSSCSGLADAATTLGMARTAQPQPVFSNLSSIAHNQPQHNMALIFGSNTHGFNLESQMFPQRTSRSKIKGSRSQHQHTVSIGEKVQFLVEVKAKEGETQFVTPLILPSVSIKETSGGSQYYQDNSAKYTMKYKGNASWLVEFKPLHGGNFTATLGLEQEMRSGERLRKARRSDHTCVVRVHVCVKGTFNIGDRVRRGPDWAYMYEDVDGEAGNSGTLISEQEYKRLQGDQYQRPHHQRPHHQGRTFLYVRWDSGNYGQYEWYHNRGPYTLELDAEL